MDGRSGTWLESLLAEGQATLLPLVDGRVLDESLERWLADRKDWLEERRAQRDEEESRAEAWIEPQRETDAIPADEEEPLPDDRVALDRRIVGLCHELASRDLYLGRVLDLLFRGHAWRDLGYANETQYSRERLGLSRSSVRARIGLSRKAVWLSPIEQAVQQGKIGMTAATLVARVASPRTVDAWIERAARRTYKHLFEEVRVAELMRDLEGSIEPWPPDDALREAFEDYERRTLSGELLREALGIPSEGSEPVQMSAGPSFAGPVSSARATVTVRLRMDSDIALHYRQLERAYCASGLAEDFITFLCWSFWRTWVHHLGKSDKWEPIYRRDGYRCTSPVCLRRDVTLHHVRYRAHGGPDDPENLTCPCAFCHLEGQHGGRLKIMPPAENPTWAFGRSPILVVEGREKRAAA